MDAKDPRHRNELYNLESIESYLNSYKESFYESLGKLNPNYLGQAFETLKACIQEGHTIYTVGNGGSTAIANTMATDWMKGTFSQSKYTLRSQSLCANGTLITALGNDFGYENIFSKQLEFLAKPGDVLVAISSSGNSQNIVNAIETAKKMKVASIGFVGFNGGKVNDIADVSLHIPCKNYGVVEDCHQSIMHILAQYLANWLDTEIH